MYYKINAFSLIESIVALILILVVFFIAIYFFATMNQSGFTVQRRMAINALNEYMHETIAQKDFTTGKVIQNEWPVSREVQVVNSNTNLLQITFTVYKKDSSATPFFSRSLLLNAAEDNSIDSSFKTMPALE